jgi:hypothetical protein
MITRESPPAPQPVKDPKSFPVTLPDDVPPEMAALVPMALDLIKECFPSTQQVTGTMLSDPEIDDAELENSLDLQLLLEGTPEGVADAFDRFVSRWVSMVPFPQSHHISLSFMIL